MDQNDCAFSTMEDFLESRSFDEGWNHPNAEQRVKWCDAIQKEFKDMNNHGVWRKIERADTPSERRCVKNKWVFKINRNGIFRARLVACGYSQVPRVDFLKALHLL